MKFYFLVILLGTAGFFMQKEKVRPVERQIKRASASSSTVFCSPAFDPYKLQAGEAPIFQGLGNLKYPVSTSSAKAQQYFNQGLTLVYAFNHGEAGRSFKAALELDSTFAMAYWGMVMVLGPNYNAALNPASLGEINSYINKAIKYSAKAKPNERALIYALRKRFPETGEVADMTRFNAAYAEAMRAAANTFPNDVEIATLYAEALMNEHPWNLWLKDGSAQPWTPHIMSQIQSILKKSPDHPGAIHYYLHAIEASREAAKAIPVADKLVDLLPSAGHLVHMPAHIYIRTGQYHKGILATEKARLADSNYITQCKVQGTYPLLYYPHNTHFLAACAFLEGNSKKALEAAKSVANNADRKYIKESGTVQHYSNIPYYVMVHLAKWDQILAMPEPAWELKYPRAIRHYARGVAQLAKGNVIESEKELISLNEIARDESLKNLLIWETNSAADLVRIASLILQAELAAHKGGYGQSIALLETAVEIEDKLNYQEPPDWFFSTRHTLGYVLLKAGKFEEAQRIYEEDLTDLPENGWALIGLYNSLKAQHKPQEAMKVKKRFDEAWKWSDITINASRIY